MRLIYFIDTHIYTAEYNFSNLIATQYQRIDTERINIHVGTDGIRNIRFRFIRRGKSKISSERDR